jgi:hypothetical protein
MSEEKDMTAPLEGAVIEKVVEKTTENKPKKEKTLKGTFILSPTGRFNLAYSVGEDASLPELQAKELEEAGYFKIK